MPPLFLIPVADDNDDRQIVPYVNYLLMLFNVMVFLILQGAGDDYKFTYAFSAVPTEIVENRDLVTGNRYLVNPQTGEEILIPGLQETPVPVYWTLLTSMFMHGSWMHLLGNMLYLWIFGDNIEDDLGHIRYLLFYLLTGLIASLAHVFMNYGGGSSEIPCLGASGAIAGVLGAYVMTHPQRRVHVLVLFRFMATIPGIAAIGFWFLMQVVGGMGTMNQEGGGVAYSAHIGGFIAGGILIYAALATRPASMAEPHPDEPADHENHDDRFFEP